MPSRTATTRPPRMVGDLLTLGQVAEILGVHSRAIVELVNRGELEGQRIGRRWEFTQAAIDDFLDEPPAWQAAEFVSFGK